MVIIGLVGGVASGKSSVAAMFQKCAANQDGSTVPIIDADAIGHRVLRERAVIASAVDRWGDRVVTPDGAIDRQQIARIVFGANRPADLDFWQRVTHPRIGQKIQDEIDHYRQVIPRPIALILDAALLFEAGWDRACDQVIFVDAPKNVRKKRARDRGWSAAQFAAREAAQIPVDQKRARCQLVIDNSGMMEQTYKRVLEVWNNFSN